MERLNPGEYGFLLLTSHLGDPARRPLTTAQFRTLIRRSEQMTRGKNVARDVDVYDLASIGYGAKEAQHIISLLQDEYLLQYYLDKAGKARCTPITRATKNYPAAVRQRLGVDAPGCLWAKGDVALLDTPMVSLVGSRDLREENRVFAAEVGKQAALQGYTLVSGNARGADKAAQNACLEHGGKVISMVADSLTEHQEKENVLYLSEDSFDAPFTMQRALSRNRVIHSLGYVTFVAQASLQQGGTWDGTSKNLRFGWSPVYCFADGSDSALVLGQMGAQPISKEQLQRFDQLPKPNKNLFDQ